MNHEIYIFGSIARGEVSASSDIDVLVIPIGSPTQEYPTSWSVYSTETIESYFRAGRLFAWHLHLEAQRIFPLHGKSFLMQLGAPADYTTAKSDIADLECLLKDALSEIRAGTNSLIYELGIAYTAIRDIAMSASWALLGSPSFSRDAPYKLPIRCPLPIYAYRGAMLARHQSTRGVTFSFDPDAVAGKLVASPVLDWANSVRRSV